MVKVQSITHPSTIISVPEEHYLQVLTRSNTWRLYGAPTVEEKEKIELVDKVIEALNIAEETVQEPEPVNAGSEPAKRKPGRPKTKTNEA